MQELAATGSAANVAPVTAGDGLLDQKTASQSRDKENNRPAESTPIWQQKIWTVCSFGLMTIIVLLCSIAMFALAKMLILLQTQDHDHLYQFAGINLVSSALLRLMAILIGGAIAFVGLAVSFFAHQKATSLDADVAKEELGNAKAALATHSPGIVAVIIGAAVIIASVYARGTYSYSPPPAGGGASDTGGQLEILPPAGSIIPDAKDLRHEQDGKDGRAQNPNEPKS
jgi:hypothetical protein